MQASPVQPVANLGLGLGYENNLLMYLCSANVRKVKIIHLNSLLMHTKQPWIWLSAINMAQQMQAYCSSFHASSLISKSRVYHASGKHCPISIPPYMEEDSTQRQKFPYILEAPKLFLVLLLHSWSRVMR